MRGVADEASAKGPPRPVSFDFLDDSVEFGDGQDETRR